MKRAVWRFLGCVPYEAGRGLQERIAAERVADARGDTLLLLEHPPTVTLGRRSDESDLVWSPADLARAGIALARAGRGGRATYHGPGQIVGYPIVRLSHGGRGVRAFVGGIEAVLIVTADSFGVRAERRAGHPGVWVGGRKLASIGIEVRRGVSRHGFALNVDVDLGPFAAIVPCGEPGLAMTDLSRACGAQVAREAAIGALLRAWARVFGALEEEPADGIEAFV